MNYRNILLFVIVFLSACYSCHSPSVTPKLVYRYKFLRDTIVKLDKVSMNPAQENARCMLRDRNKILIRTSTTNAVYSVFTYPEFTFLNYFGEQSEYNVPLSLSNNDFYLVRGDSLIFYSWNEEDTLKKTSAAYFHEVFFTRLTALEKLSETKYAYSNNISSPSLKEFFLVDISKHEVYPKGEYPESSRYFKSNSDFRSAYAHSVVSKPDGSRLLVYYYKTRRCRFYNEEGDILHDVLLNYEPCQNLVDVNIEKRFSHITTAFATENFVYLLCPDNKDGILTSSLLILNWEGEAIARYRMDSFLTEFFIDESANRFCGVNSNDFKYFYLLNLSV